MVTIDHTTIQSYEDAEIVAARLSEKMGEKYIPADNGGFITPRFDAIRAPQVGDPVSYTFHGDFYPCGNIAEISKDYRIIRTTTQRWFSRRGRSAAWISEGIWTLVLGHHYFGR